MTSVGVWHGENPKDQRNEDIDRCRGKNSSGKTGDIEPLCAAPHRRATRAHYRLRGRRHLLSKHSASCEIIGACCGSLLLLVSYLPLILIEHARSTSTYSASQ